MGADLQKINYGILQEWVRHGRSEALPAEVAKYLNHLELVRSMYSKYESKAMIINLLCLPEYGYSKYTANKLYSDAINFFYADNDVKKDAWRNVYAEKLENAALLAWESQDMETYRKLIVSAAEIRGLNKDELQKIPSELLDRRPVIYIMDPKRFNLPEISRRELAEFIDNLDISEKYKTKAKRDALCEDVEFEIFEDEENQIQ